MKKLLILLAMVALSPLALANGEGGCHNENNPHYPCEDDGGEGNGEGNGNGGDSSAVSDASAAAAASAASDASAYGTGIGVGIAEGGDASATGGSAAGYGGDAVGVGGDAAARAGVSGSGNARNSTSVSTSFNYEVAAASAATLITGVCQDGTSVQGVKFGMSSATQSVFCKYTTLSQLAFQAGRVMQCATEDYQCWGDKEFLREEGVRHLNAAAILVAKEDRTGVFKHIFGWLW